MVKLSTKKLMVGLILLPWLLFYNAIAEGNASGFTITYKGNPEAVIIIGEKANITEQHAAEELCKYINIMSGAQIPIKTEKGKPESKNIILIGTPQTHGIINRLVKQGLVELSDDYPGLDGFIIKSLKVANRNYLVLGGSMNRGTLYAVYHLLEKYCEVGFFRDGDHVPKMEIIKLPRINLAERPQFRERMILAPWGYSFCEYWGFDAWKKEIDWMVKNKLNEIAPGRKFGYGLVCKLTLQKMGVKCEPPTKADFAESEFAKRIYEYLHKLDLNIVANTFPYPEVSAEFREVYPEARYFPCGWFVMEQEGKEPPYHIYATDPVYKKWVKTSIETWRQLYGITHLHYGADAYPETYFKVSDEERDQIVANFSRGVMEAIKAGDPEGKWYTSGWNFLADPTQKTWTKEIMERFFKNMQSDDYMVWDLACDKAPIYKTERGNYWYGKEWTFCVIHEFGGDDFLQGDLRGILRKVMDMVNDPKANRGVGFGMTQEVAFYNILYYDFLPKLAWNPKAVSVEQFLEDYIVRRYGKQVLADMLEPVRGLAQTVYSASGSSDAGYQHRHFFAASPSRTLSPMQALTTIKALEKFLSIALAKKKILDDNQLYQDDLVDYLRQYITELFNLHFLLLKNASIELNNKVFEQEAKVLEKLLNQLEVLLSSSPRHRVGDLVKQCSAVPWVPKDVARHIRDEGLTFALSTPTIIDYGGKDMYELVKFYYHPRISIFLKNLRKHLQTGKLVVSVLEKEIRPLYEGIERRWVEEGYDVNLAPSYQGTILDAVQEVFQVLKTDKDMQLAKDAFKESALAEVTVIKKEENLEIKVSENIQLVEGFSSIISYANRQQKYPDFRGGTTSWWEYYRDTPEEITWETAVCPEKKKTVFVFIASNGEDYGQAELYVNGKFALIIESAIAEDKQWQNNRGYMMVFNFKQYYVGNSGIYFLVVPEDNINAGEKCKIKVSHVTGGKMAWFMIKDYTDVLKVSGLN